MRLVIEPHLSIAELDSNYRTPTDPIERTRYQIVWLLARGFMTEEVASVTRYHRDRIRKIARVYNQIGPQALIDRRRVHPGREPMLSDFEQAHLWQPRLRVSRGWCTVEWSCIRRLDSTIDGKTNSSAAWVGVFAADEFQATRATAWCMTKPIPSQQQEWKKGVAELRYDLWGQGMFWLPEWPRLSAIEMIR